MRDVTFALPILELGISTRAANTLTGAGINTIDDVIAALEKGDEALTGIKGFGPKSLVDLKKRLRERGVLLPGDSVSPQVARAEAPKVAKALEEEAALAAALFAEEGALEEEAEAAAPIAAEAVAPITVEEKEPEMATPVVVEQPAPEAEPAVAPRADVLDKPPSLVQRLRATIAHARRQPGSGAWAYGVIGVLIIVALMLPPVSLLQRLGIIGYVTINAENNTASHSDGLTLTVNPATFDGRLRVRLDSVPREDLLMGNAGSALKDAVAALPAYLKVKSPLYQIQTRGDTGQPVTIDVLMPNNAEPWETLDLYTWTGESWEWVGSELHTEMAEHEHISAQVTDVPDNLVVVQAEAITTTVSTFLEPGDDLASAAGLLDEVNPTGLLLGTSGDFVGDPNSLLQPVEGDGYAVMPTLRNWVPGASANLGLLSDLLTMPEISKAHIANIVQLCVERGFAGVDVDYRGVTLEARDEYSEFIGALASALHAEGLRLTVVVKSPTPTNGGWDTGGYDWAAIGSAADAVKVPFPVDPAAYVEMGEAQRLLDWATAQVSRHKLHMLVSSLSVELSSAQIDHISLERALAPFGEVIALDDVTQVEPGSQVKFGFSGRLLSITPQAASGTYRLEYEADDGGIHSVWLGTATNLTVKLGWARRYHLGGVAVSDMLASGNSAGIVDAVAGYRSGSVPPAAPGLDVVWTISSAGVAVGQQVSPLTDPGYTWMVAVTTGTYTVNATVAGFAHGSVTVGVAEVITGSEDIDVSEPAVAASDLTDECFDARYVADVTVPDNTQLDNGEAFVKTWRVRNAGTCDWPEDTVLAFSGGCPDGRAGKRPGGRVGIWRGGRGQRGYGGPGGGQLLHRHLADEDGGRILWRQPLGGDPGR